MLAAAFEVPIASAAVARLTTEPRFDEEEIVTTPCTVVRPGSRPPWPALVLVNGATEGGRHHPAVRRLATALARAGHLVLVPDPPGLARAEISEDGVAAVVSVASAAASRPDALADRVALLGVSVGTTLALLAAEQLALAGRVSVIAGLSPYTDLTDLIRLATTGVYSDRGRATPYQAGSFLALSVGRSVAAGLEPGPDRARLVAVLAGVQVDDPDPLAALRRLDPESLAPPGRAVLNLLVNRDPTRFDALYATLSDGTRARVDRLSPIVGADRLGCPIDLFSQAHDKYFPLEHSRRLVEAVPYGRLTVTSVLEHADVRLTLRTARDLARLAGLAVRVLRQARFG